jgi:hypothetical protein
VPSAAPTSTFLLKFASGATLFTVTFNVWDVSMAVAGAWNAPNKATTLPLSS